MSEFKHYLVYKTTNIINKKIYIGVHATNNIDDGYFGSGTYFKRSLRYYGKDKFIREILYDFDNSQDMLKMEAELVTKEFVKRKDTYNLVLGGESWTYGMICVKDKDGNMFSIFKDDPRYLSGDLIQCTKGTVCIKDKDNNKFRVDINDPRYLSGELVGISKGMALVRYPNDGLDKKFYISVNDPKYINREVVPVIFGYVVVIDKNGKSSLAKKDDPRYLNGELISTSKGKITVKDNNDNYLRVSKDDPRYLNGELNFFWCDKKHTDTTKNKISEKNKINSLGNRNSQYGKKWIHNLELKMSKRINKDEAIPDGWVSGRKINWN